MVLPKHRAEGPEGGWGAPGFSSLVQEPALLAARE